MKDNKALGFNNEIYVRQRKDCQSLFWGCGRGRELTGRDSEVEIVDEV